MLGIKFDKLKWYLFGTVGGLCLTALTPAAHAGTINSTDGFCCFSVTLTQTDADDVAVSVALTNGATLFANTGNNTNHPGFAFNLAGAAITSTNIVSPTDLGTFHVGPDATGGPSFGTFDYFFDIPGSGTSGNDAGPLTFTVSRSTGVLISDFDANAAGFLFAADICEATTADSPVQE